MVFAEKGGEIGGGGEFKLGKDQRQEETDPTRGTTESLPGPAEHAFGAQEKEKESERTGNENESGGVNSTATGTTTSNDRDDTRGSETTLGEKDNTGREDGKTLESIPT